MKKHQIPNHVMRHFQKFDPTLHAYVDRVGEIVLTPSEDFFASLCSDIIGQQLSGKAADTIYGRFEKLFPKNTPTAQRILKLSDEKLRSVGISGAKTRSLKDLAMHIVQKKLNLSKFPHMTNDEIKTALIQVKGIGPWTAEMFLMFSLARKDVFSFGDLGLKKAIQRVYGLKNHPTERQMLALSKKWQPYRTYAARILWKVLDTPEK